MSPIEIIDTEFNHNDLSLLITQLDQYLFGLFPPEEVYQLDFDDPNIAKVEFVTAYLEGNPVGCGAIKEIDESTVELKRFFVIQACRNQGVAGLILKRLEDKARNKNYKAMKLETGDLQVEAIGFYKKSGFIPIDRFGEYVDCPSSICMEKKL